jgi:hypothetical protein
MRKLSLVLVLSLLVFSAGKAGDDLSTKLSSVGTDYAKGYLQPLTDAFGADINSGFFHGAKMSNGFHLYFGLKAFAATIPSADQAFSLTENKTIHVDNDFQDQFGNTVHVTKDFDFTLNGTSIPTVFGDDQVKGLVSGTVGFDTTFGGQNHHIEVTYAESTIAGLKKLSFAPLGIPQVTVGTIMGTDFTLRLIPKIDIGDYGSVGFWGVGVRHSISQYLGGDEAPLDIAVGFMIQNFTITAKDTDNTTGAVSDYDLLKAKAWLANVEVSKQFNPITFYGGLQIEKASMDVQYFSTQTVQGAQVKFNPSFSADSKNTFRAIIGINLGLGPLNINADYNVGSTSVLSGGLGFSF